MATRSNIAIQNEDGTIESIYCHWDGYPEGVGATLKGFYNTEEKVKELIALGDLSSLGFNLEGTVAYHRDRGERKNSSVYNSYGEWVDSGQEFLYLFKNSKWRVIRNSF